MHVQIKLGHKSLKSTQTYINIEETIYGESGDEFHFATAKTVEEAGKLISVGFDYVATFDGTMLFRKRK